MDINQQFRGIKLYNLEKETGNFEEAVKIRRKIIETKLKKNVLKNLPFKSFPYEDIYERCCENVIGYVPIPVGLAGPIVINEEEYYLPIATIEGTLVASITRGCKAIVESGGCQAYIIKNVMTRAPVIKCPNTEEAIAIQDYCMSYFSEIKSVFDSTSKYAKLEKITPKIVGKYIFLRFYGSTGDAMGMNMLGKGTEKSILTILSRFPNSKLKSLSGNMCVDKKASALNWIEGRGKYVICEAIICSEIVESVLKTSVSDLIETNYIKNMIGSSISCTIGGNNAHASNIVSAMFLACGQDIAQNVESSHCITLIELAENQKDLYISVTLPCLEVGTIGGGTHLPGQSSMLDLLGIKGSKPNDVGQNAKKLAKIISAGVLAGELSLLSALSTNELVRSHMKLNRKK